MMMDLLVIIAAADAAAIAHDQLDDLTMAHQLVDHQENLVESLLTLDKISKIFQGNCITTIALKY